MLQIKRLFKVTDFLLESELQLVSNVKLGSSLLICLIYHIRQNFLTRKFHYFPFGKDLANTVTRKEHSTMCLHNVEGFVLIGSQLKLPKMMHIWLAYKTRVIRLIFTCPQLRNVAGLSF